MKHSVYIWPSTPDSSLTSSEFTARIINLLDVCAVFQEIHEVHIFVPGSARVSCGIILYVVGNAHFSSEYSLMDVSDNNFFPSFTKDSSSKSTCSWKSARNILLQDFLLGHKLCCLLHCDLQLVPPK